VLSGGRVLVAVTAGVLQQSSWLMLTWTVTCQLWILQWLPLQLLTTRPVTKRLQQAVDTARDGQFVVLSGADLSADTMSRPAALRQVDIYHLQQARCIWIPLWNGIGKVKGWLPVSCESVASCSVTVHVKQRCQGQDCPGTH
jgi:hypothetical protein